MASTNEKALVKLVSAVSHLEIKGIEESKTFTMSCRVHLFLIYQTVHEGFFLISQSSKDGCILNILKSKGFAITLKMLLEV